MTDLPMEEELANLKAKYVATQEKFSAWNVEITNEVKEWFDNFESVANQRKGKILGSTFSPVIDIISDIAD